MNYIKATVALILALLLLAGRVNAQDVISLDSSRAMAIQYNKQLQEARLRIGEAEANKKEAFTNYLPKFDASGSGMYLPNIDNIGMPGFFLPTANSAEEAQAGNYSGESDVWFPGFSLGLDEILYYTADLSVSQAVYAGGKIRNANKMADIAVGISKNNLELNKSQILEQTDKAYWTVLAVKESLKLAGKYIDLLTELEEQLTDSYELGLVPRSDLLQVRVQKNQAELNEIQARNGLKLAKMQLCQIIGLDVQSDITISDTVMQQTIIPDTSESINRALSLRQELNILEKQIEINELERKNVRADYLPQFGIGASYSYSKVNDLMDDGQWNTMISGQISIPVFHWRESSHRMKAAQLRKEQSMVQLANTRDLISLEVSQAITRLDESIEAIALARKSKTEAEESLEETRIGYDAGLNNITQVLDAQASWQQAHTELIRALTNFEISKARYKRVVGK